MTPYKTSFLSKIRVDQAPGFRKLFKQKSDLSDLGIELELGEAKNKNSLALVDRKMRDLEDEIKKLAPSNNVIGVRILARATSIVNEKDVNKGNRCLSAKEILFSRDQFTGENLVIKDEEIAEETMVKREKNNEYSSKSKASVQREAVSAGANKGQIVFLKEDGGKLERRDMYLVIDLLDSGQSLIICKLVNSLSNEAGSLQPQNFSYKVRQTDVYLAPNQPIEIEHEVQDDEDYLEEDISELTVPEHEYVYEEEVAAFSQTNLEIDDEDESDWDYEENEDPESLELDDSEEVKSYGDQSASDENNEAATDKENDGEEEDAHRDAQERNEEVNSETSELQSRDWRDLSNKCTHTPEADDQERPEHQQHMYNDDPENEAIDLFEDDLVYNVVDPIIDQPRKPRKGDTLKAVIDGYWRIIQITSENRKWKEYYNFKFEDGTENGMYLHLGSNYWTFAIDDNMEEDIDVERQNDHDFDASTGITPATSDNEREEMIEEDPPCESTEYLDDDYSDQESIFGSSNIEYLTNSFSSAIQDARHDAFATQAEATLRRDNGRAYNLVQKLNLELPQSGQIVHNKVYKIPPGWRAQDPVHRSRVLSASWSVLQEAEVTAPARASAWQRGIDRLRRFLRVSNPFRSRR